MSIDWKKINDNIVNVGSILAKFIDTEVPQDVSFVLVKDDGDIENITLKNLTYRLAKIKQNAVKISDISYGEIKVGDTIVGNYINNNVPVNETYTVANLVNKNISVIKNSDPFKDKSLVEVFSLDGNGKGF